MICKVCGRTVANEEANFCEYCGASFREMKSVQDMEEAKTDPFLANGQVQGEQTYQQGQQYMQNQPAWQGQSYQQAQSYQQMPQSAINNQQEKPISFLNWLGTMLLPYIPFIGSITYLVMLFVWAFGRDSNPSKKNWARARLVVTLIGIISLIILIAYVTGTVLSSGMTLEDYVNNTYY